MTRNGPLSGATAGPRQSSCDHGSTAGELEAIVWVDGARRWLDYGVAGHVPLGEAVSAAQLLLERAAA